MFLSQLLLFPIEGNVSEIDTTCFQSPMDIMAPLTKDREIRVLQHV